MQPERISLVTPLATSGHSVRVPGVLSEEVTKKFVLIDEHEIDALETLGRRLDELGVGVNALLIHRLVQRWKMGPRA